MTMQHEQEDLPILVTADQAEIDLEIHDAAELIGEWIKAGRLRPVGSYSPHGRAAVHLYSAKALMTLATEGTS
jgi:hypothetical protein